MNPLKRASWTAAVCALLALGSTALAPPVFRPPPARPPTPAFRPPPTVPGGISGARPGSFTGITPWPPTGIMKTPAQLTAEVRGLINTRPAQAFEHLRSPEVRGLLN